MMVKSHARLGIRQSVFSQRIANDWYSILAYVVDSPTLNTLKTRLNKF